MASMFVLMWSLTNCENWCDQNRNYCQRGYGLPRKLMPQLSKDNQVACIFKPVYVDATKLVPMQFDIYQDKVDAIVRYYKDYNNVTLIQEQLNKIARIVIAQNANGEYVIIDGHHRWASFLLLMRNFNRGGDEPSLLLCYLSPFDVHVTWNMIHVTEKTFSYEHLGFSNARFKR